VRDALSTAGKREVEMEYSKQLINLKGEIIQVYTILIDK